MSVVPVWIGSGASRLFGVLHEPAGAPRASVLFCPPFLHEYVRSHRLFAQLAEELAMLGFAVLRIDYRGTGDSSGADEAFSMSQAIRDAQVAADRLRAQWSDLPLIALGIRAGAYVAAPLLRSGQADRLWLWQPIVDGADYLRRLRERQSIELRSPMRFPVAKNLQASDASTLMGYPCAADFADELTRSSWSDAGLDASRVTVLEPTASTPAPAHSRLLRLPKSLSAWVDELDMARVPVPPIKTLAHELAGTGARA